MKETIKFICNKKVISAEMHPATSLLDFIRQHEHLTGTKEGCREGDCGACTVLVGEPEGDEIVYKNVNSCLVPLGDVANKHVVTIEGLNSESLSPIQESFIEATATQCGFCTPGFIISLTSFLLNTKTFDFDDAVDTVAGNICRCTGHISIKRGINKMLEYIDPEYSGNRIEYLIQNKFLPEYFKYIPAMLKELVPAEEKKIKRNPVYNISGGTDLFVQKWEDLIKNEVSFIEPVKDKNKVVLNGNNIVIKARTTVTEFKESEIINKYFPILNGKLNMFGSLPIRNRATLGGNIINASPIGDMVNILLALGAVLLFEKDGKARELPLDKFYLGYKTLDKKENEILKEIIIPIPEEGSFFNYEKVSKRTYLDIASVNSSILMSVKDNTIIKVKISAGGVAPIPALLYKTAEYLSGKEINAAALTKAVEVAGQEVNPISDARGSADYKRILLQQLLKTHLLTLFPDSISFEEIA
jgi:xanthine dehydrogenase small subunit